MAEAQEEIFHEAADYLGQLVTDNPNSIPDSVKLQLYGLYKQATTGRCTTPRPPFWNRAGRMKWNSWHQLGDMPQAAAMIRYVEVLSKHQPNWTEAAGASSSSSRGPKQRQGGAGGPVFSTLRDAAAQQQEQESSSSIHALAGQGDAAALQALLQGGNPVDARDDSGCTALHFAADRGQLEMMQLLLDAGADINAADADGQTPLHYAALCGQLQACKLLLERGADSSIHDSEGQTAQGLAPAGWDCWKS